jgi:WD40 repeat protein
MESSNNGNSLEFCEHLKQKFFNPFVNKYVAKPDCIKNFYCLKNLSVCKNVYSKNEVKDYIDQYMINNINMEWVALNNPQNLSLNSLNREGCIFTIAFDDTGETMAASNHNHHIEIWDMQRKRIKKTIYDHKEIVTGLEFFHGNSNMMMSCSLDKTIKLWRDNENIDTFLDHSDWVRCIAMSGNNKFFLSGCVSSVIKFWDLNEKKVLMSISNPNPDPDLLNTVNSLQFMNTDDNIFLCGLRNGTVKIFDRRIDSNFSIVKEFKAHKNKLNSIKFNKSDMHLLSSGRDSTARLWDFRKLPVIYFINF